MVKAANGCLFFTPLELHSKENAVWLTLQAKSVYCINTNKGGTAGKLFSPYN